MRTFSCGGASPYEADVDKIVAGLAQGSYPQLSLRVAERPTDGALIGLCATQNRPFNDDPVEPDSAYVGVIAVNEPFRGQTWDGAGLGDLLLNDALSCIRDRWGGGPLPRVWALVDPPNAASHRLFDRHDFYKLDAEPGGYDIRFLSREEPGLF